MCRLRQRLTNTKGYTYEYFGADNFQEPHATGQGGVLAADGPADKSFIFNNKTMTSVISRLLRLARAGFWYSLPALSPEAPDPATPRVQSEVILLVQEILTSENTHRIPDVASVPDSLMDLNLAPRVTIGCDDGRIFRLEANQGPPVVNCPLTFSVSQNAVQFVYELGLGSSGPWLPTS